MVKKYGRVTRRFGLGLRFLIPTLPSRPSKKRFWVDGNILQMVVEYDTIEPIEFLKYFMNFFLKYTNMVCCAMVDILSEVNFNKFFPT